MQVVENDYPAFCHFLASYDDKRGLGGGAQPKLLLSFGGGGGGGVRTGHEVQARIIIIIIYLLEHVTVFYMCVLLFSQHLPQGL